MDENKVVEEEVIVDNKEGTVSIIWKELKTNWWKGLIGLGAAAAAFAGGYFLGSNQDDTSSDQNLEEPPFVEGGDLI